MKGVLIHNEVCDSWCRVNAGCSQQEAVCLFCLWSRLSLWCPFIIKVPPHSQVNGTGSSLVFLCEVFAFPMALVEWRKEGQDVVLPGDDPHISVQVQHRHREQRIHKHHLPTDLLSFSVSTVSGRSFEIRALQLAADRGGGARGLRNLSLHCSQQPGVCVRLCCTGSTGSRWDGETELFFILDNTTTHHFNPTSENSF